MFSDQKAVDLVRKCNSVEEASHKLVETALQLGTMDNTTAIVVGLNWNLEFLTSEEIQGFVEMRTKKKGGKAESIPKQKIETPKMEPKKWRDSTITEALERNRSNTSSFRDAYVDTMALRGANAAKKSIYLPVTGEGLMIKLAIPAIAANKLMKFEKTTLIKEIILMVIKKHRFVEAVESYSCYFKEEGKDEIRLDSKKQLFEYPQIKDKDTVELRLNTGAAPVVAQESPDQQFPEALIPSQYTQKAQESQDATQSTPQPSQSAPQPTPQPTQSVPPPTQEPSKPAETQQQQASQPAHPTTPQEDVVLGEYEGTIYRLEDKEWKVLGQNSKICFVKSNTKIRIVGETPDNQVKTKQSFSIFFFSYSLFFF